MSIASDFNALGDVAKLGIAVLVVYVVYNLYTAVQAGVLSLKPDANDTQGNPNSVGDTSQAAYAGNGIFGILGNLANQASGGILQSAGNALGGALAGAPSTD